MNLKTPLKISLFLQRLLQFSMVFEGNQHFWMFLAFWPMTIDNGRLGLTVAVCKQMWVAWQLQTATKLVGLFSLWFGLVSVVQSVGWWFGWLVGGLVGLPVWFSWLVGWWYANKKGCVMAFPGCLTVAVSRRSGGASLLMVQSPKRPLTSVNDKLDKNIKQAAISSYSSSWFCVGRFQEWLIALGLEMLY